jgi:hypothetical protein
MELHYDYNWTCIPPVSTHDLEFGLILMIIQAYGGLFHCLFFVHAMDLSALQG